MLYEKIVLHKGHTTVQRRSLLFTPRATWLHSCILVYECICSQASETQVENQPIKPCVILNTWALSYFKNIFCRGALNRKQTVYSILNWSLHSRQDGSWVDFYKYSLMVSEMDSVLILLTSWMMALARHRCWDLHLLIMEAAFLFGCHSFRASDSVGVSWERFEID